MNVRRSIWLSILIGSLLSVGSVLAQEPASTAPDNTRVNRRDRSQSEPTADQQTGSRSDREITQQIRRSIVQDKSLSTYAHNIKVVTQNGEVTLKGPVRSDEEKRAVESKATEIAGENKVNSQLDVKPKE
jgi:hyperosmotically inducible periplasmic protein